MKTVLFVGLVLFVAIAVMNEVSRRIEAARTIGSLRALFYVTPAERLLVRARGSVVSGNDQLQALRLERERLYTTLVFARHGTAAGLHEVLAHNPHYVGSAAHRAVAHMASLPRPVVQDRMKALAAQPAHRRLASRTESRLMRVETKIIRLEGLMAVVAQPGIALGSREQLMQGPVREAVVACEDASMMDSVRYTLRGRQGEFEQAALPVPTEANLADLELGDLNLSGLGDPEFGDDDEGEDAEETHPLGNLFQGGLAPAAAEPQAPAPQSPASQTPAPQPQVAPEPDLSGLDDLKFE